MSNHDDSCEAQGPGESCCCVYRAEIDYLQKMVADAAQALNDEEREIERLRGLLRAVADSDVLGKNEGQHREWYTDSCWLYPGDAMVNMDLAVIKAVREVLGE